MNLAELADFLVEAKVNTYAAQMTRTKCTVCSSTEDRCFSASKRRRI